MWHGDPSQTIVNAADRGLVDLIAMTTHGWRGLDRLRFGSVAESVVRKARVPVLLVRGQLRWPADRSPRILVPLDGSEQSAAILALVAKLRRRLHAAVELLHVLEALPPAAYPDLPLSLADASPGRAAARGYLDRVAARFAGESPKVDCVVLEGPATRVIARRIVDSRADLVAMTTQGRSGVVYQTMGFPVDMFPVLFAIPRTAGPVAGNDGRPGAEDRASPAALPRCHAT